MPRASSVDPCLICGQLPCQCNAKPKKAAARPRPKAAVDSPKPGVTNVAPAAPTRQSMIERMRARAAEPVVPMAAVEPVRARPTAASAELPELTLEQAAELAAVRALSNTFEIKPDDLAPYQLYLDKPVSPKERSAQWKLRRQRNGEAQEG